MSDVKKRKERSEGDRDRGGLKRSKGGSGGRWQTPHQKAKFANPQGSGKIEAGDAGIWATCARNQEKRAATELKSMLEDCAERFYGIVSGPDEDEDGEEEDIEASIQKELESMNAKQGEALFSRVRLDLQCVLFFKTGQAIDPVDFVHRICLEIASKPEGGFRRMRYINRLTPMTSFGRATEKGIEEVGKAVLGKHFQLRGEESKDEEGSSSACSYAIRPTIRNHKTLSRDVVIKQTAALVADTHKVDLAKPDKVIIVEVFQTVCGMSVVGSDWESLKRFNVAELYPSASSSAGGAVKAEAKPESVTTNEVGPGEGAEGRPSS